MKIERQHITLTFLLCFLIVILFGQNQNKTDSLLNALKTAKEDTSKVNLYNKLSWQFYLDDPDEAKKHSRSAIELSKILKFERGLAEAYNKMGILEKITGNYDEALNYYNRSLELAVKLKDSTSMCMLYSNMGNVHKSKGDYPLALKTLFKALKMNENVKNEEGQADCLVNIGLIYDDLKNNDLALDYLEKSLSLAKKINDDRRIGRALTNIANIYSDSKKTEDKNKALEYYNQALQIDIKNGDKKGQSMCLNNIGAVYYDVGQYTKAEDYYKKSLVIKQETGDRKGIAIIYENFAYIEQEKKNYKKAGEYFTTAIAIVDSIGDAGLKISLLKSAAENYYLMGDYKSSAETHELLFRLNDSIFNSDMSEQLSEMQTKYETEKKDKEILVLNKDKEIKDKEIGRQKIVRNSIIGISVLILILLVGSVIAYRDKKKANVKLEQQNIEITKQKEEITYQRDSITHQKEIIEEHQKEIKDSINYAKRIQTAVMPGELNLYHSLYPETIENPNTTPSLYADTLFVLFRPKDIVSGDFYWATRVNEWFVVTVADCTGHGVPGSFMSMLGISFLNEIIRKKEVTKASDVLDHLRASVIDALKQKGESGEQKDGMDIALCVINMNTLEMQFAGANNPMWIVRDTNGTDTSVIEELKPDKQPVAIHAHMHPFSNHSVQLNKGDTIYLSSDGYQDQFGGPKGKKYLTKNLKQLIIEHNHKPMNEQREVLNDSLETWINGMDAKYEQTDDITVVGIRL
ncbi:MAG: tetratricopeptide repeat protein [Bacteroidota bacterium]|nr:tetratricopeptide repeat protein [Bacteroidota bacterium]